MVSIPPPYTGVVGISTRAQQESELLGHRHAEEAAATQLKFDQVSLRAAHLLLSSAFSICVLLPPAFPRSSAADSLWLIIVPAHALYRSALCLRRQLLSKMKNDGY